MYWPLEIEDRHRVVDALMAVDAMGERRTRSLCLEQLELQGYRLEFERSSRSRQDLWELVNACLKHSGALQALVDLLRSLVGDSKPVLALKAVVDELVPEALLSTAERRDLRELVAALEKAGAGELLGWLPAVGLDMMGPAGPMTAGTRLGELAARLEDAPYRKEYPPLLMFVGLLAGLAPPHLAAACRAWMRGVAERLEIEAAPEVPMLAGGANVRRHTYLAIECVPDAAEPENYLITAWLQRGAEPGVRLDCPEDPQRIEVLPDLVSSLLRENRLVTGRDRRDLTIEFILPRELFLLPVDWYEIEIGGIRLPVGAWYPVVMRSMERLRDPTLRLHWQDQWDWLKEHAGTATVFCVEGSGAEPGWLTIVLTAENAGALALPFPPRVRAELPGDELAAGLAAGTPIIVWCRNRADPEPFTAWAKDLLGADLMGVPGRALDLRREAVKDPDDGHPGRHLALIFDDADRIPEPYQRLRPPV